MNMEKISGIFGRQIGIHYWIVMKIGVHMDMMSGHHTLKYFQNQTRDGVAIEYASPF